MTATSIPSTPRPGDLPPDHPLQELLVIRHGETEWNSRKVIQGFKDIPLSAAGIEQTIAIAGRLAGSRIDAIYTSPLKRAADTAEAIRLKLNLPVTVMEALKEINCGEWEGKGYAEVKAQYPAQYQAWMSDPEILCPGGESFNGFVARVGSGLQKIFAEPHARVLISGHSGVSRAILAYLLGMDFRLCVRFEQRNTALNIFRWENGVCRLKLWNGTRHLDDVV
jgi:probable phosphoglycerate mutase